MSGGVTERQCVTQVAALGKDLVVEEAGVHLLQLLRHHHQTFDGLLDVSEGTLQEDIQFQHEITKLHWRPIKNTGLILYVHVRMYACMYVHVRMYHLMLVCTFSTFSRLLNLSTSWLRTVDRELI